MAKKTKPTTTNTTNLPELRVGTRVRCTDDGVDGRIVRANGLMVTVAWSDGEKVTWRRDTLATKPIEIIDPDTDEQPTTATEPTSEPPSAPTPAEQTTAHEQAGAPEEPPAPAAEAPPVEPTQDASAQEAIPAAPVAPPEPTATDAAAPEAPSTLAEAITWEVLDASKESPTYLQTLGTVKAATLGEAKDAAKAQYATPHIVQAPAAPMPEPGTTE